MVSTSLEAQSCALPLILGTKLKLFLSYYAHTIAQTDADDQKQKTRHTPDNSTQLLDSSVSEQETLSALETCSKPWEIPAPKNYTPSPRQQQECIVCNFRTSLVRSQ